MDLRILLNREDITQKMELSSCNVYDRLGGMLDSLKMQFPYDNSVEFNRFDELEIIADKYATGVMYVTGCNGVNNNASCLINAVSSKPTNKNKRSRTLTNVTLHQIIDDVAKSCGVTAKLYDVVNYTYESVSQVNETDLQFLNRICLREGYSIKLDNGNLVVFNDYSMENNYESAKIKNTDVTSYEFKRAENGLRAITVQNYSIEHGQLIYFTASDTSFDGGADIITEYVSEISEAERFAKGYLRQKNNMALSGTLVMDFNTNLSAGTTVDLQGFEEYDGKYIIYELRHDIANERTHAKIRKTLDY